MKRFLLTLISVIAFLCISASSSLYATDEPIVAVYRYTFHTACGTEVVLSTTPLSDEVLDAMAQQFVEECNEKIMDPVTAS